MATIHRPAAKSSGAIFTAMKHLLSFIKWLASIVEDKRGAASSKRIGFFIILWIFRDGLKSGWITHEMIWPFVVMILIAGAWSIPEWFAKLKPGNNETT